MFAMVGTSRTMIAKDWMNDRASLAGLLLYAAAGMETMLFRIPMLVIAKVKSAYHVLVSTLISAEELGERNARLPTQPMVASVLTYVLSNTSEVPRWTLVTTPRTAMPTHETIPVVKLKIFRLASSRTGVASDAATARLANAAGMACGVW